MDNRYYGFDAFDRGVRDDEVSMLFCADNSVYGTAEIGVSTINNVASVSKVDACANSVSTLSCDVSALTASVNETARALKELTERVNRMDYGCGDRLRRSDLRTLRVG